MMKLFCRSLLILPTSLFSLWAAPGIDLVSAAYGRPRHFEVAPGQVLTLVFRGVKPLPNGALRSGDAVTTTLPTSMAGFAARILEGVQSLAVPIFSVRQENECGELQAINPACVVTSMRVQIPFELGTSGPRSQLILEVDGQESEPFPLEPVPVHSHILTTCDLAAPVPPPRACERLAFHNDGTPVDAARPVKRGEVIVMYAFGLGATSPAAETGKPSPIGSEALDGKVRRVWTAVRNQPLNASGSAARFFEVEAMTQPTPGLQFAGLAPGLVGLYQINVQVPHSFEVLLPCGGEIRSNALVLVTTRQGSDTVPFCVAP